jgi:hypothetical protein
MNAKPRMTKQGVRDLNYYGPKPAKIRAAARPAAAEAASDLAPPAVPPAPEAPAAD